MIKHKFPFDSIIINIEGNTLTLKGTATVTECLKDFFPLSALQTMLYADVY